MWQCPLGALAGSQTTFLFARRSSALRSHESGVRSTRSFARSLDSAALARTRRVRGAADSRARFNPHVIDVQAMELTGELSRALLLESFALIEHDDHIVPHDFSLIEAVFFG